MKHTKKADIQSLEQFDDIIDVRTPAEFAEDHIPGAINCPVLSNEERIVVGTANKQDSPFEANKLGASLISRNIADLIQNQFYEKPKNWRPLFYCWRGGNRSGAIGHVLNQIGWRAQTLDGGYKTYRRFVIDELSHLPAQFNYQVITGPTGSAKSRFLEAVAAQGGQVIDLEGLANHKGSVLGGYIDAAQPTQRMFESQLLQALRRCQSDKTIYIEAESRKIGTLQVPETLLEKIRTSPCLEIQAPIEARIEFLIRDYDYFIQYPEVLKTKLGHLKEVVGVVKLAQWGKLIDRQDWPQLVKELLSDHYDALYKRSQSSNFINYLTAQSLPLKSLSQPELLALAKQLLTQ
ncbi:MAG: tRNA 2-selenouridine(34) synthase MnmH [Betaproteobacteria bacterium]